MPESQTETAKNFGGSDKLNSWMLAIFAFLIVFLIVYLIMIVTYYVLESNSAVEADI